jgi:hypothetical protein
VSEVGQCCELAYNRLSLTPGGMRNLSNLYTKKEVDLVLREVNVARTVNSSRKFRVSAINWQRLLSGIEMIWVHNLRIQVPWLKAGQIQDYYASPRHNAYSKISAQTHIQNNLQSKKGLFHVFTTAIIVQI